MAQGYGNMRKTCFGEMSLYVRGRLSADDLSEAKRVSCLAKEDPSRCRG